MPLGHFREYILHITMASRWLHDIVKPSHTIRINFVCRTTTSCIVRECFGYNRVSIVCLSVGFVYASAQHWLFSKFVTKITRSSKSHIRVAIVCQNRLGPTPAIHVLSKNKKNIRKILLIFFFFFNFYNFTEIGILHGRVFVMFAVFSVVLSYLPDDSEGV